MSGVLEGIRVVDITQGLCGPYASLLLADAGAQVVKVEPPEGDYARGYGPPFHKNGASAVFTAINRGKQGIALDLGTPQGKQALSDLIATADVFLEDLGPGIADALGIGYATLSALRPSLIYCSITPFGTHGPYADRPGSELVVQAISTSCIGLGAIGEHPVRMGTDISSASTAAAAAQGIMAALFCRMMGGQGQLVEVDMLKTIVAMRALVWAAQSDPDYWQGWQCELTTRPPDHAWQTKDRPVYFNLRRGDEQDYYELLIELGLEAHLLDPRFGDGGRNATGHGLYADELVPVWEKPFAAMTAEEVCDMVNKHHGEATPFNNHESLFRHPQLQALGIFHKLDDPNAGLIDIVGPSWKIGGVEWKPGLPAPRLGQHTPQVFQALGYGKDAIARLSPVQRQVAGDVRNG